MARPTVTFCCAIAMGADMNQTIKANVEAERYQDLFWSSPISQCEHGIKSGMGNSLAEEKKAVECDTGSCSGSIRI